MKSPFTAETSPTSTLENNETIDSQRENQLAIETLLNENNIPYRTQDIEGNTRYPNIIILEHIEAEATEYSKLENIQLFRAVNSIDESLLNQTPYAARSYNEAGEISADEDLQDAVTTLAQEPTYSNAEQYFQLYETLHPEEGERIQEARQRLQKSILDGYSVRRTLQSEQIAHNGKKPTLGIAPYIAAANEVAGAVGYGEALLVLTVPQDKIEPFSKGSTEFAIKGQLTLENIQAIIPKSYDTDTSSKLQDEYLRIAESLQDIMPPTELNWDDIQNQNKLFDQEHTQEDLDLVYSQMTEELFKDFQDTIELAPLAENTFSNPKEHYQALQLLIYESLLPEFKKLGKRFIPDQDLTDIHQLHTLKENLIHLRKTHEIRERLEYIYSIKSFQKYFDDIIEVPHLDENSHSTAKIKDTYTSLREQAYTYLYQEFNTYNRILDPLDSISDRKLCELRNELDDMKE